MHTLNIGAIFEGNNNGHVFVLEAIKEGRSEKSKTAIVKDITTGHMYMYGYDALCRLNITVIKN